MLYSDFRERLIWPFSLSTYFHYIVSSSFNFSVYPKRVLGVLCANSLMFKSFESVYHYESGLSSGLDESTNLTISMTY